MKNFLKELQTLSPKQVMLLAAQLKQEQEQSARARNEPIAIVGMACRFPGGVTTPDEYWQLLSEGRDAVVEVPRDRWDLDAYYDPSPEAPGKMSTRFGGFLKEVDTFDAAFFGISPREAVNMDPQQRMLLEVAWEAFESANLTGERLHGSATGVFIGISGAEYFSLQTAAAQAQELNGYMGSGTAKSVAAGRISYTFGLTGPSVAVDTACSSSIVAVHQACESLRRRECDVALAGAANLTLDPLTTVIFSKARMLSPDGRCKTYDDSANGFVRGEGVGAVALKRLSDALAQGDRILAVVRGSAINQDGATAGLTVPHGPAQQGVIRRAMAMAGVEPAQVSYVEAHGTGTSLGDPIELGALGAVFGKSHSAADPLWVGSVKTNFGHLEAAAGMAGLIKVVLCLQHRELPPHLHLTRPSTRIPWSELPLRIPLARESWRTGRGPLLAGLSAFSFSGTNAHILVEEGPARAAPPAVRHPRVMKLSARSSAGLSALAQRYASMGPLSADALYTANTGRSDFPHRAVLLAGTPEELQTRFESLASADAGLPAGLQRGEAPADPRRLAMLFSGQGSQYAGMGKALYESEPVFQAALDRCAGLLAKELPRPLLSVLWGEDSTQLGQTQLTQPALFSLEYALGTLWRAWGLEPTWVLGHSLGEFAAACLAEVFSLEDAVRLVAARGRLMQQLCAPGAMAAVFVPFARVQQALAHHPEVTHAAENEPELQVVAGPPEALSAFVEAMRQEGCRVERLATSHAFHSPMMEPMLAAFTEVAQTVTFHPPRVGFISSLTGEVVGEALCTPSYWVRQIRETVRFERAARTLGSLGANLFLEVGPGTKLLGMTRRCIGEQGGHVWAPSMREKQDEQRQLFTSLGALYVAGATVDWTALEKGSGAALTTLPTYPFQRRRFWFEANPSGGVPGSLIRAGRAPTGSLLGERLVLARSRAGEAYFETTYAPHAPAHLGQHRMLGGAVVSLGTYAAAMLAAARAVHPEGAPVLRDLTLQEPLLLSEETGSRVQVLALADADGSTPKTLEVTSLPTGTAAEWLCHARAQVHFAVDIGRERERDNTVTGGTAAPLTGAEVYEALANVGYRVGPVFQWLDAGSLHPDRAAWTLGWPKEAKGLSDEALLAVLLDVSCHALSSVPGSDAQAQQERWRYLPTAVAQLQWHRLPRPDEALALEARLEGTTPGLRVGSVVMLGADGVPLAQLEGLRFERIDEAALRQYEARVRAPSNGVARRDDVLAALRAAPVAGRAAILTKYLLELVQSVVSLPEGEVGPGQPLNSLGIDSLMAVEIRTRARAAVGVEIAFEHILGGRSAEWLGLELSTQLTDDLLEGRGGGTGPAIPAAVVIDARAAQQNEVEGEI